MIAREVAHAFAASWSRCSFSEAVTAINTKNAVPRNSAQTGRQKGNRERSELNFGTSAGLIESRNESWIMFADCRKHQIDSSFSNLFEFVWSVLKHVFVLSVVGIGFGESGGAAPDACGISKEILSSLIPGLRLTARTKFIASLGFCIPD
jgi:hypothetical protein